MRKFKTLLIAGSVATVLGLSSVVALSHGGHGRGDHGPGMMGDYHGMMHGGPGMMQGGPGMMRGGPGMMRGGPGWDSDEAQARREQMRAYHQERMQRHMDELKSVLKLQPEQEEAWNTFTEAMAQQRAMGRAGPRAMRDQAATSVTEHFKERVEFMEGRLESMKQLSQAADTFYNSLSAEQKAAMDGYWVGHHGGRMGWRR